MGFFTRDVERKLDYLTTLVFELLTKVNRMTVSIDDLKADVASESTVVASVVTLLGSLATQLQGVTKPEDLAAIIAGIDANKKALADAVAANTPAAPTPAPKV